MIQHGLVAEIGLQRSGGFSLDLELSIPVGRTAALLGPNGAGKSTTVAAIAGLISIERGRIEIGGQSMDNPATGTFAPPEARRVGVVFQDFLLFPHLRVGENVAFGLRSRGVPKRDALQRADEWLDRVGLAGFGRRLPGSLSGGQSQRVALARALITEPDLLLLDEPLSALDVTTRAELRRDLSKHMAGFRGARLFITHDPTEAFLMADEIHIIESGTITQSGSPDDIRMRPHTRYAADLAGSNLVKGRAHDGLIDTGLLGLQIADRNLRGQVLLSIPATAISIFIHRPEGSPRNTWQAPISLLEDLGERVRLRIGPPLPLTVEITHQSKVELGLRPGLEVWVSFKATEVHVEPGA
jgi:molybdate transport system ATP-binding protein